MRGNARSLGRLDAMRCDEAASSEEAMRGLVGRCGVLKVLRGIAAMRHAARLLHFVTGPVSTGFVAVRFPAQSIELRCFALRGHCVMSGMPPVGVAKGGVCGPLR